MGKITDTQDMRSHNHSPHLHPHLSTQLRSALEEMGDQRKLMQRRYRAELDEQVAEKQEEKKKKKREEEEERGGMNSGHSFTPRRQESKMRSLPSEVVERERRGIERETRTDAQSRFMQPDAGDETVVNGPITFTSLIGGPSPLSRSPVPQKRSESRLEYKTRLQRENRERRRGREEEEEGGRGRGGRDVEERKEDEHRSIPSSSYSQPHTQSNDRELTSEQSDADFGLFGRWWG